MTIIEVKDKDLCIAPFAIHYTKDESDFITEHWLKSGNKYIVDPLSADQCLVIEYEEMDLKYKIIFCLKYGCVKLRTITREEYNDKLYKTFLE